MYLVVSCYTKTLCPTRVLGNFVGLYRFRHSTTSTTRRVKYYVYAHSSHDGFPTVYTKYIYIFTESYTTLYFCYLYSIVFSFTAINRCCCAVWIVGIRYKLYFVKDPPLVRSNMDAKNHRVCVCVYILYTYLPMCIVRLYNMLPGWTIKTKSIKSPLRSGRRHKTCENKNKRIQ